MAQKCYQFTRLATYTEFGYVYANDEEEALQKVRDDDYDDIVDTWWKSFDPDTIELREDPE